MWVSFIENIIDTALISSEVSREQFDLYYNWDEKAPKDLKKEFKEISAQVDIKIEETLATIESTTNQWLKTSFIENNIQYIQWMLWQTWDNLSNLKVTNQWNMQASFEEGGLNFDVRLNNNKIQMTNYLLLIKQFFLIQRRVVSII
jgi:hypothetical protein